ncbi:hypothetical protein H2509_19670 [Stappia sp. F7233]|uniref:Uncharacterized protein n=1 Tax=Stappia albiluteola TaxID=2758565 RepID=A0A839AK31_9HYPH|nr:type VI secretion system-associated protein TagO [Stappia albiluteola]MBA5779354.1 hypothetical protein [Stappia albiluteola]
MMRLPVFALVTVLTCGHPAAAQTIEPAQRGWLVREEGSAQDGSATITLQRSSRGKFHNEYFDDWKFAEINIRCFRGHTSLWFHFVDEFMEGREFGLIRYSLDGQAIGTWQFEASPSNKYLGLWEERSALPVLEEILKAGSLAIEVTPNRNRARSIKVAFDVSELAEEIEPLREACGW